MKKLWQRIGCALVGCCWGGWVPLAFPNPKDRRRAMRQCFRCHQLAYQYTAPMPDWDAPGWPQRMEE